MRSSQSGIIVRDVLLVKCVTFVEDEWRWRKQKRDRITYVNEKQTCVDE